MKKLCGLLAALTLASCADEPSAADQPPTAPATLQPIGTGQKQIALVRTPGAAPAQDALAALRDRRAALGLSTSLDDFQVISTERGMDGIDHVRLQQTHGGVPVWGGDVVVHAATSAFNGVGGNLAVVRVPDVVPAIPATSALAVAQADYARGANPGLPLAYANAAQTLVILPSAKGGNLAWHITFFTDPQAGLPLGDWNYFVDAHTGAILKQFNGIQTLEASGPGGNARVSRYWSNSLDVIAVGATQYQMATLAVETLDLQHGTSGGYPSTSSTLTGFFDKAADDAQGFSRITLNMLSDWFGYNSIDNNGFRIVSRVHYMTNYPNAGWDGSGVNYGDGNPSSTPPSDSTYAWSGALDIVAHEIDHGFTQYHSHLTYTSQSGAMNESFSDIAGTAAKYYYSPSTATMDFGADIFITAGVAKRYMCNPTADNNYSIDNYANYNDSLDVHSSSGIMNKAFCRAARRLSGVDVDSGAPTAAGIQLAAKAWYAANASYWTSSSTFAQGCQGVVDASLAIGYSPPQAELIGKSWEDVGVVCNYPTPAGGGVTGDFNGDGYADLLALYQYPGSAVAGLWVFPGAAPGTTATPPYRAWYAGPNALDVSMTQVAAGDFNGDNLTDVLVLYDYGNSEARLFVIPGTTTVGANVTSPYSVWHSTSFNAKKAKLTAGKFDSDTKADGLVLYDNGSLSASLLVFPGTASIGDTATAPYTVWTTGTGTFDWSRVKITAGDFTGDTKADVIGLYDYSNIYGYGAAGILIWPGTNGHTSTSSPAYRAWYGGPGSLDYHRCKIAAGDFDNNGYADLMVLYDYGGGSASLFMFPGTSATGDTATAGVERWHVPGGYFFSDNVKITAGDFTGDTKADLIGLYDYGAGSASLFVWPGASGTGAITSYSAWSAGPGSFEVPRAHIP